ncbi:MAG: hypothetical protein LBN95_13940, partial [Prevotellaceae bacterium]|nr:hypothetical protein [Prevotellaceae bacterium]
MRNYLSILIFCFTANFVFATNVTVNNYTALVSAVGGTADTIYINGTIVIWQHLPVYRNLVFIGINNGTLNGNNNQRGMAIGATKVEIHNLTFINGGDYMFGCAFIVQLTDTLIVKNCHFLNNTASIGGAIYGQYNNYILLENCEFKNNHTTGEGGAICMMAGATSEGRVCSLYIVNCLFYNNSVETADGGAIYAHFLNNLIIFNSLFYNNSSLNLGGAIRIENTPCNIINSTIVKNTSNGGGGIWSMNIGPNLYNSIIVGNTANIGGANQADILGEPANIYNSIYQGVFSIGNNINNFSGILPANIFVDYNNDDFHLLCSSVAIDGGNNTDYVNQWNTAFSANTITSPIVHNDIGGNVRLLGSNIDMGAYETLAFNETISDSFCEGDTYDFNGR